MPITNITPKELKARLDQGELITVIDVRESWELAKGRTTFATHIPMDDIPDRLADIPHDVPVVIMCHLGGRSAQVTAYLNGQGYENVVNLDGGIARWAADVDPAVNTP